MTIRAIRLTAAVLVCASLLACGGGGGSEPPPATRFVVTPSLATAAPGVGFTVKVAALDAAGNVATSYSGSVRLSSSDGAAVLPAPAPLTNGLQTLSVTMATSGLQTISATDTVTSSLTGQSQSIAVTGPATHLLMTVPAMAFARAAVPITVTALDASNTVVTSFSGSVLITSSDGQALLPTAAVRFVNGSVAFNATLLSIGTQTLTATDTVQASIAGTSPSIDVSAAPAIAITSAALPGGTVGSQYSPRRVCRGYRCFTLYGFSLLASEGLGNFTWAWAAAPGSSLPPGLSLTGNVIGGTPPVGSVGSYHVIVTATDGGTPAAQANFPYTISIVNPAPPFIAPMPGPQGATLNQPYRYQFQVSGFAPFTFTATGALPPGLAPLTSTGLIAGTPASLNLYPITVHATDPAGQESAQTFTIGVFQHGFSPTGSMQTTRWLHTATLLPSGQVLVTGGMASQGSLNSSQIFTPTSGSFVATAALHVARYEHTATLLCDLAAPPCANSKVLVVGGSTDTGLAGSAELYDPTAGTFTLTTGNLATDRVNHSATRLHSGKVLIVGGTGANGAVLASAELFDPATGTFTATAAPMASTRIFHTATLLPSGKVLIAGGVGADGIPLDSAELYNPVTGTFSTIASPMTVARDAHTATLLPGGKVLIAGGAASSKVAAAELYDPATVASAASFTVTGVLVTPRDSHTAVLLPSGQVLIVGGLYQGQFLQHAELYDPATGVFASTGGMQTARIAHTLTSLGSSGHVLVAGGLNGSILNLDNEVVSSAEVYQ